jgi:hypothetical protein
MTKFILVFSLTPPKTTTHMNVTLTLYTEDASRHFVKLVAAWPCGQIWYLNYYNAKQTGTIWKSMHLKRLILSCCFDLADNKQCYQLIHHLTTLIIEPKSDCLSNSAPHILTNTLWTQVWATSSFPQHVWLSPRGPLSYHTSSVNY